MGRVGRRHIRSRVVAEEDERVVGWAAFSPVSSRWAYRGVAESSVYVARDAQGKGVGRALMRSADRDAASAPGSGRSRRRSSRRTRRALAAASPLSASASSACASASASATASGATPSCWNDEAEVIAMIKVEAVVIRERIETVIDAVEDATGHVGVTVIEAVGHGRAARHHARVPRARLRVAVPAEGAADLRRRRRHRRRGRRGDRGRRAERQRVRRRARLDDARRERHAQPNRACRLEEVEVG